MSVTFQNGCWIANFDYDNSAIPKSAGFLWHGGNCRPGCKACAAGLKKVWWTPYPEKAARLEQYCDAAAKAALGGHLATVAASQATDDTSTTLAVADGLNYLGYQKAGIAFALNRKGTLITDEMGLGKTIQALGIVANDSNIDSVLVICPASLRLNWLREAKKWATKVWNFHVVENNELIPLHSNFVIVNYDRLKGNILESLMHRNWGCLIVDECFPAGTLVDTPTGQRPIESIKVGDLVLGATGPQVVKNIGARKTNFLLKITFSNGITITCTENHPFFTNKGWIPAWISQCEDRAHRIGQTESVLIQHLVLDDSLDCRMAELIVEKQEVCDRALDLATLVNLPVIPRVKGGSRSKDEQTPAKYPESTLEEKMIAAQAIQSLAAMCDGAVKEDGHGFNKIDAFAGHSLAARSKMRSMTDGEVWFAKKLIRKYRRQLPVEWIQALGCEKKEDTGSKV